MDVKETLKKAADKVGEAAKKTGDAIGDAARKAGEVGKDVAGDVADGAARESRTRSPEPRGRGPIAGRPRPHGGTMTRDHARRLALAALIGIGALQTACPGYFWRHERREERVERRQDNREERRDNRQERREDRRERWD